MNSNPALAPTSPLLLWRITHELWCRSEKNEVLDFQSRGRNLISLTYMLTPPPHPTPQLLLNAIVTALAMTMSTCAAQPLMFHGSITKKIQHQPWNELQKHWTHPKYFNTRRVHVLRGGVFLWGKSRMLSALALTLTLVTLPLTYQGCSVIYDSPGVLWSLHTVHMSYFFKLYESNSV